jgi:hypothetical protein
MNDSIRYVFDYIQPRWVVAGVFSTVSLSHRGRNITNMKAVVLAILFTICLWPVLPPSRQIPRAEIGSHV